MEKLQALLICLLTVYAPIELTWLIMVNKEIWSAYSGIPIWQFMLEMALFWVMYIVGIALVYRRLKCPLKY